MRQEPRHPSIWKRTAAVWTVLFFLVASSWHICELGGRQHCHPVTKPAKAWKPKCGGGIKCPCKPPKGVVYSATGYLTVPPVSKSFDGTCLAKLLLGMPGGLAAPVEFVALATQRVWFLQAHFETPSTPSLPQPPARGPPLLST